MLFKLLHAWANCYIARSLHRLFTRYCVTVCVDAFSHAQANGVFSCLGSCSQFPPLCPPLPSLLDIVFPGILLPINKAWTYKLCFQSCLLRKYYKKCPWEQDFGFNIHLSENSQIITPGEALQTPTLLCMVNWEELQVDNRLWEIKDLPHLIMKGTKSPEQEWLLLRRLRLC